MVYGECGRVEERMTFDALASEILMPADFSVLRTPEILETFEIRTFFCEKWLLSHVSRASKSSFPMQAWNV